MKQATPRDIAGNFGTELAGSLAETATGGWSGPYPSAFGWHLVRVTAREPSRLPQLSEIRPQVERDWLADRRARANERFYEALKGRYQVRIDLPEAGSASPSTQAPPGSAPDAPQ